jgi:hypothetical protein
MGASRSVDHGWRCANGGSSWTWSVHGLVISKAMSALRLGWGKGGCYRASEVKSKGAPGNETETRSAKSRQERQVPPSTARRPAGMRSQIS